MEKPRSPAAEHVKEIAWAVLMIDLMLVLSGAFVAAQTEVAGALWLFAGAAAVVTVLFAVMLLANFAAIWIVDFRQRRRGRPTDHPQ